MDLLEAAIARVFAADPRGSIDEVLALLEAHTAASASGLFLERDGGDLELVMLRGVEQSGLDRVRQRWATEQERLRDDRPACEERWCVWPFAVGRRRALIYLESHEPLRVAAVREAVVDLAPLLAAGLASPALPTSVEADSVIDSYLESTPASVVERRQLLTLLNRNEWNLSRVARLLGVTRVTVYNRMDRLGIKRIRLPKTRPYLL